MCVNTWSPVGVGVWADYIAFCVQDLAGGSTSFGAGFKAV